MGQKMSAKRKRRAREEPAETGLQMCEIGKSRKDHKKFRVNLLLLGDTFVGKSPIMHRIGSNEFKPTLAYDISVGYIQKSMQLSRGWTVEVQITDVPGMFWNCEGLLRGCLTTADGALLVCDVTNRSTLHNVPEWKCKLDCARTLPRDGSSVPCLLLANKIDLVQDRVVHADSLGEVSTRCDCVGWREVSARDGTGVQEAFRFLVRQVLLTKHNLTVEGGDFG